jgi:hypothetical protein
VIDSWCFVNNDEVKDSSCISNEIFKEGGCSVIKNKRICEDINVLFDIENGCSWIKDSKEEEYCIDSNKSPKCSYYITHKGCSKSEEDLCSWIKVGDVYDCAIKDSAELCEYYVDSQGCTKTSEGDICKWNTTVTKCLGVVKSCEEYISYSGCNSVNERCFWNGNPSTSKGQCLSLEKMYSCEELSMELCKNYSNFIGLTINIEPCFYNYIDDIGGFYCVTTDSVMNTRCENVKTNKNVGGNSGPKYCDNAQLLFKNDGIGFGCEWEANKCFDAILEEDDLPEDCSGYITNESCNYHMTKKGKSCFWNPVKDEENDTFCTGVDDVIKFVRMIYQESTHIFAMEIQ